MLRVLLVSAVALLTTNVVANSMPILPSERSVSVKVFTTRDNTIPDCSPTRLCRLTRTDTDATIASLSGDVLVNGEKGGTYSATGIVGSSGVAIKVASSLTRIANGFNSVDSSVSIASFFDLSTSFRVPTPPPVERLRDIRVVLVDDGELIVGPLGPIRSQDRASFSRDFTLGTPVSSNGRSIRIVERPDNERLRLRIGSSSLFRGDSDEINEVTPLVYTFEDPFSDPDFIRFPFFYSALANVDKTLLPPSSNQLAFSSFENTSYIESIIVTDINGVDVTDFFDILDPDGNIISFGKPSSTATAVSSLPTAYFLITGLVMIGFVRTAVPQRTV